jgi:hypothetical protein
MITGDLLSAAGLLVTLVGLLYSVWYGEMNRALAVPVARHRLDREPDIATVRRALFARATPSSLLPVRSSSSLPIQR